MKEGEIYDSELLRNTINELISKGKRNFSIDFSSLDYIYSDTINVLLAINKRILDVSGRLSILSPGAEVRNILNRAGIQNILKIYENEFDLQHSSEDIIKQTQTISLSEIKGYINKAQPKSDFASLQTEIQDAISQKAADVPVARDAPVAKSFLEKPPQHRPAPATVPVPPVSAARPNVPASSEEYVFDSPKMPAQSRTFEPPAPSIPKSRRATGGQPPIKPESFPITEAQAAPTIRRPVAEPAPMRPTPVLPQTPFAAKPAAKARFEPEQSEWEDEEELSEKPKSLPIVPIAVGAILVILIGGLITIGIMYFSGKKSPETVQEIQAPVQLPVQTAPLPAPAAPVQPPPAAPQVSKPLPSTITPQAAKPVPPPAAVEPHQTVSDENRPQATAVQDKKSKNRKIRAEADQFTGATPAAPAPAPAATTISRLTITSSPSGASVKIDGKLMGVTPYTLNNPAVLGTMEIVLSKPGYGDAIKIIDFQGGSQKEFIALEKVGLPSAPAPREAEAPRPAPPAPSAPAVITEPAAPAPAPAPPAPSPAAPKGDPAVIFIASNPPMADVYIDGKQIGKTNINKLNVFSGTHSMRFEKSGKEAIKEMTFNPGDNPPQFITLK